MTVNKRLLSWAIVNITGIFLLLAGIREGWVLWVLAFDTTYISYIIIGFLAYGITASFANSGNQLKYAVENCVSFGFLGTILGILIALSNVDASQLNDFENLPQIFASLTVGLGVAFSTSIVGSICALYLYALQNFAVREK
jgi:hypothetical protein